MAWPGLELGLLVAMAVGGIAPTYASPRRSVFHLLNSAAFAAFAILGLECLRLVLPAALASALVLAATFAIAGGGLRRRLVPEGLRLPGAVARLAVAVLFLALALLAAAGANRWLGDRPFPLPLTSLADLFAFIGTATVFGCVLAALNEAFHHRFSPPIPQAAALPRDFSFLPSDAPLYRLMLVSGSSLQVLAQFLYLSYGVVGLFFALGWFALAIRVQAELLKERLRLNRAFRELEASQRALVVGELTGRIVHQTRHQLGLLRISTHLIREGLKAELPDRAKILEQIARVDGVVAALGRMLSEALGGRSEAEVAEPAAELAPAQAVSLRAIVQDEVERLRGKAEQLGVGLRLEPGPPGWIEGAAQEIEPIAQGLFNVVDNALGAARGLVRVVLEEAGSELRVVVEDDGPGMASEILERAGEPFVTTKDDGTGIGLFVAAAAAKRWGGRMSVENRREGGLRVSFTLPLARRDADPDASS